MLLVAGRQRDLRGSRSQTRSFDGLSGRVPPENNGTGRCAQSRMRGVGQQLFSKIEEITRPAEDSGSVQEQPGKLPVSLKAGVPRHGPDSLGKRRLYASG